MNEYSSQAHPNPLARTQPSYTKWVVLGIIAVLAVAVIGYFLNVRSAANRYEQNIVAQWKNNENILSSFANKVAGMAQVATEYKKGLIELVKAEMEGRYGNQKNVTVSWIKENGQPLDASLYKQIQQTIDAGRDEFKHAQSKLLDVKREYTTMKGELFSGFVMDFWGYPKIDLDKYDIVISQDTKDTFGTGIDNQPQIFQQK